MYGGGELAAQHRRWWELGPQEAYTAIGGIINAIDNAQANRRELNLHHMRLYGNYDAASLSGADYAIKLTDGRLKMNVVRAVIDTATAHISTVRSRPSFTTMRGNWSDQRKAKNLNKFSLGQFLSTNHYEVSEQIFRDAGIFGTGIEHIYDDGDDIKIERVFPNEILVDNIEAKFQGPRQIFRHKEVARDVAIAGYPKHETLLLNAGQMREAETVGYDAHIADPISLIEVHRPPIGDEKGYHAIVCSEGTLVFEEWQCGFPYAIFQWSLPVLGFFGTGLAYELTDIQLEINYTLQKIQRSLNLASSQIWALKNSVNLANLSNEDYAVREFEGQPPMVLTPNPIAPQYFQHVWALWDKAFDLVGISQLSATGTKPAGLNSGAALRVHQDIESKRFQHIQKRWESYHIEAAEKMIDVARRIDERKPGGYKILAKSDKSLEELSFSDVDLEKNKYIMQVFPTSLLPATPAGKLQTMKELGEVSPEIQQTMLAQLDIPDVDAAVSLLNAPIDVIDLLLERMLEHGEYRSPEPYYDLELALRRCQLAVIRAEIEGADEDRLQLVRNFMEQCRQMLPPPPAPLPASPPPPEPLSPPPEDMMPVGGPIL
jgi:hypothetical protein